MDKTKKYQIGSLKFNRAEYAWTSEGWNASCINDEAMERFISDGIATEVKEKLHEVFIVPTDSSGGVTACNPIGEAFDTSTYVADLLRAILGDRMAMANRKFRFTIKEL